MAKSNLKDLFPEEYTKMTMDDIVAWCAEHDELEWLENESAKTVSVKQYQRARAFEGGKWVWRVDKKLGYVTKTKKISFVKLKYEFCKKYRPELIPEEKKKTKTTKLSMAAKIAAAKAAKEKATAKK